MQSIHKRVIGATASAGLLVTLGVAAVAGAGGNPVAGGVGPRAAVLSGDQVSVQPLAASSIVAGTSTSTTTAGYFVSGTAAITSFDATFVVPTLTCPTTGTYSATVAATIEGAVSGGTFVSLQCNAGVPSYGGTVALFGATLRALTVAPGDKINVKLTVSTAAGTITVTDSAYDVTAKEFVKVTASAAGSDTGVAALVESPVAPVPPFGTLYWSGLSVNGGTLTSAAPIKITLLNNATAKPLVTTATIPSTGKSFSNKRLG